MQEWHVVRRYSGVFCLVGDSSVYILSNLPFLLLPGLCVAMLALACLAVSHQLQTGGVPQPPQTEFFVGFLAAGVFACCFVPVLGFLSAGLFLFVALPASLFFLGRLLYRGLPTRFHAGAALLLASVVLVPAFVWVYIFYSLRAS